MPDLEFLGLWGPRSGQGGRLQRVAPIPPNYGAGVWLAASQPAGSWELAGNPKRRRP